MNFINLLLLYTLEILHTNKIHIRGEQAPNNNNTDLRGKTIRNNYRKLESDNYMIVSVFPTGHKV